MPSPHVGFTLIPDRTSRGIGINRMNHYRWRAPMAVANRAALAKIGIGGNGGNNFICGHRLARGLIHDSILVRGVCPKSSLANAVRGRRSIGLIIRLSTNRPAANPYGVSRSIRVPPHQPPQGRWRTPSFSLSSRPKKNGAETRSNHLRPTVYGVRLSRWPFMRAGLRCKCCPPEQADGGILAWQISFCVVDEAQSHCPVRLTNTARLA